MRNLFLIVPLFLATNVMADPDISMSCDSMNLIHAGLPSPPINLGIHNLDQTVNTGWLNYNDHPHATLACTDFLKELKQDHAATCAGVYDVDFDKNGNMVHDTVVVLKFTDLNGKLQVSFNAPLGTHAPWPTQVILDCSYDQTQ